MCSQEDSGFPVRPDTCSALSFCEYTRKAEQISLLLSPPHYLRDHICGKIPSLKKRKAVNRVHPAASKAYPKEITMVSLLESKAGRIFGMQELHFKKKS
jgi:hypothetical protein